MSQNKHKTKRILTDGHKKKIGNANRGHRHTEEAKKRIGHAAEGNKYALGYKHTDHAKKKIIQALIRRTVSQTTRQKIAQALRGEKNGQWKGGVTPTNEAIRKSLEYKLWRVAVFERDDYTCVWCGMRGGELNADHIKPFAYFPELRFAINNGRTLCVSCHRTTDTWGGDTKFKRK